MIPPRGSIRGLHLKPHNLAAFLRWATPATASDSGPNTAAVAHLRPAVVCRPSLAPESPSHRRSVHPLPARGGADPRLDESSTPQKTFAMSICPRFLGRGCRKKKASSPRMPDTRSGPEDIISTLGQLHGLRERVHAHRRFPDALLLSRNPLVCQDSHEANDKLPVFFRSEIQYSYG